MGQLKASPTSEYLIKLIRMSKTEKVRYRLKGACVYTPATIKVRRIPTFKIGIALFPERVDSIF